MIGGKLTVLHLVANRWWTGSADPVLQLVAGLGGRGHRVLLGLVPGDRFEAKAREAGIEPVPGLSLDARFRPGKMAGDLRRLRALARAEAVDVIHAHQSHDHWLGALTGGPSALVRTFHRERAVRGDRAARWLYRRTDALIAVSGGIETRIARLGLGRSAGTDPARASLYRVAGVADVERFAARIDAEAVRATLGAGDGPLVGTVARLAPGRGHRALILGFADLARRWPAARLVLVGKGEERGHLVELVARLGLGDRVLLAGYRDADLPAVVAALDVFVLMASGSDESCRAALEAMAAGRPVVAGRSGALPEIVEHGVTGLLLDGPEPDRVASALVALLEAPERARAMGEAGRARALSAFSPAAHAAAIEAIYGEVLRRRARA